MVQFKQILYLSVFFVAQNLYATFDMQYEYVIQENLYDVASLSKSIEELPRNFKFIDRASWAKACAQLPLNIDIKDNIFYSAFAYHPDIKNNKKLAWQEFDAALMQVFDFFIDGELSHEYLWIKKYQTVSALPIESFYDVSQQIFMPYVQKLDMNKGDKIIFRGDIHGDIHALMQQLQELQDQGYLKKDSFEIADKNIFFMFLGDYVDKGNYGAEVIYTLLRLKLANPGNVILVRGNHEDSHIHDGFIQKSEYCYFSSELAAKFESETETFDKIYRLYNFMPVAVYLGHNNNYLQCSHGGLEYGYKPKDLLHGYGRFDLVDELQRQDFKEYIEDTDQLYKIAGSWMYNSEVFCNFIPTAPINKFGALGFMWFDFMKTGDSFWKYQRGLQANKNLTQLVLEYQNLGSFKKIRGIFRAHQHSNEGRIESEPSNFMSELIASNGVYKVWQPIETSQERSLVDGIVWTFNVAPDTGDYGKNNHYGFDTYAILSIDEKYEDWKLQVYNSLIIDRVGFDKPNL